MHTIAIHALRGAIPPISKRACRVIGGIRRPYPRRSFHRSAIHFKKPETPDDIGFTDAAAAAKENGKTEVSSQDLQGKAGEDSLGKENITEENAEDSPHAQTDGENPLASLIRKRRVPGRAKIRRQTQPEGLPPVVIPEWFIKNNVKFAEDLSLTDGIAVYGRKPFEITPSKDIELENSAGGGVPVTEGADGDHGVVRSNSESAKYSMHLDIYNEIHATLNAGLALRPPKVPGNSVVRTHTLLQCPKEGGSVFLDTIIETMASKLGTDLIQISPQDIAQIVGPYIDENLAWTYSETSLLGYDTQKVAGKLEQYVNDIVVTDGVEGVEDGDLDMGGKPNSFEVFLNRLTPTPNKPNKKPHPNILSPAEISAFMRPPSTTNGRSAAAGNGSSIYNILASSGSQSSAQSGDDQWNGIKIGAMMDALISSADSKRASANEQVNSSDVDIENHDFAANDIIVQLKDYKGFIGNKKGMQLLELLQSAINKRWRDGRNILLVGTTSTDDCDLTKVDILNLQSDVVESLKRTILVTPERREDQDSAFVEDEKARIRNINVRHIEDMISKLLEGIESSTMKVDLETGLDNAEAFSAGLEDAVWTYARVHRLSTTIIGLATPNYIINGPLVTDALRLLASSDEAKIDWGAAELKEEEDEVDEMVKEAKVSKSATDAIKEKIKKIRKTLSTHEKRLLGGVIIPADITTTFDDVHVPKETIEALKTLTSLSLQRPEAFSYGVLANNKIPGLLLYGPPGTGKTLLAKAVAKESGAVVLEISGAEVNDMYVGEGEKNVKAIFSLAKKLSPCVVFIDEADAILASRNGAESKRTTHRETINQFLREWDGMNDLSAFIMVATNRPFDLDEAVLRRLPRRLLVDLPTEKDRESILEIHLRGELLDDSVSLSDLAKNTPFYSGSDLKNLSVAAALACIREENAMAAQHIGEEPYTYPEKRLLSKSHFDQAANEISASISDDMSTLTAIRKFDEKYGDRKGRRKKTASLGFGGSSTPVIDLGAGRVRKVEVLKE